MRNKTKATGYICGVAWQHEVGETDVMVYKNPHVMPGCTKECGIVEVQVRFKRWLKKQRLEFGDKDVKKKINAGKN